MDNIPFMTQKTTGMLQEPVMDPYQIQLLLGEYRDIFVSRLPLRDQIDYVQLLKYFQTSEERNRRYLGLSTFRAHLERVYEFIHKGDALDIYRGFVCGIEFGHNFIVVNTKRLKVLMCRSKSCVNGCLQKLGYLICRQQQDISGFFSAVLPGISTAFCNSRQWCVRISSPKAVVRFESFLPQEIAWSYGLYPSCNKPKQNTQQNKEAPLVQEQQKRVVPLWDISLLLNRHIPSDCVTVLSST
jgi:hypothetical protein